MTRRKRSSGDVFQDLGFSPEESAHLRIRSELMRAARKVIDERRLTQAKAAALFGVTQPRVSDLVRGKMSLFSIDGLIAMLSAAGVRVEMRVVTGRGAPKNRVA